MGRLATGLPLSLSRHTSASDYQNIHVSRCLRILYTYGSVDLKNMPHEREFHVIVHPSLTSNEFPGANARAQEVWRSWGWTGEAVGRFATAPHALHGWDSLTDTGYLNDLPPGTKVIIGGQVTEVCVRTHAEYIALHPRARELTFVLDRQALVGSDEGLDHLVTYLQEQEISASVQE